MPYHLATRARLEKYARDRDRTCESFAKFVKTPPLRIERRLPG